MSESWAQEGIGEGAGQPAAADAATAGALLRRAREAAGLHVAALAVSLKVPASKLEALEQDRWDLLPDAVFARALAATVCRTLKIDPQQVLDRLPQTAAPRLIHTDEGINAPFRAPGDGTAPTWLNLLSRPVYLIVFALLLGALVLILLPSMQRDDGVSAATSSPKAVSPAPPVAVPGTVLEPAANVAQPMAAMAAASGTLPAGAASPASAAVPAKNFTPASAAKPASSAAAASAPATVAANDLATPASGIVVFRTKSGSWVEVTDAKGVVAVRRLLAPGEAAGASGVLPLQVTVGRADATEVQVRGKPFDLQSISRDNVARFEVK
ncbi:MAG TPA: RodZ domain-containing protein [Ramlibacter sp.]|nr:RodZ domain-containing protein [Ramlibacter sp.]